LSGRAVSDVAQNGLRRRSKNLEIPMSIWPQAIGFLVDIAHFSLGTFNSDYFSAPKMFLALLIA